MTTQWHVSIRSYSYQATHEHSRLLEPARAKQVAVGLISQKDIGALKQSDGFVVAEPPRRKTGRIKKEGDGYILSCKDHVVDM